MRNTLITLSWRQARATSSLHAHEHPAPTPAQLWGWRCLQEGHLDNKPRENSLRGEQQQTPLPGGSCLPLGRRWSGLGSNKLSWAWAVQRTAPPRHGFLFWKGTSAHKSVNRGDGLEFYEGLLSDTQHLVGLKTKQMKPFHGSGWSGTSVYRVPLVLTCKA